MIIILYYFIKVKYNGVKGGVKLLDKRRREILNILNNGREPIKGTDLGEQFGVSRQVIVQDIAVLRAEGADIIATPRGYMIMKERSGIIKKIVSDHGKGKELEDELRIIVNNGGKVIDVIVEHPVYGEITAPLDLENNRDIDEFLNSIDKSKGEPLLALTGGIHIHTLEVMNEEDYEIIERELIKKKYLKK